MTIAVLALQGAFLEHKKKMEGLGVNCIELRQKKDLEQPFDGLILPGGESTVQGMLLHKLDMYQYLKARIVEGMPVLATCAGLILLAEQLSNDTRTHFATLPVTVKRNAYGRQLGSFYTKGRFGPLKDVPMTFIRAPYIESVKDGVEILSQIDGRIVGVRCRNQLGLSFHPELDEDERIHQMFLKMAAE